MPATPPSVRFTVTAEIIAAITSSLVIDEVLANVAQHIAEALALAERDIYGYDSEQDGATCQAFWAREPQPG